MRWCPGVWLVACILFVEGIDVRIYRRYHGSTVKVECFDYPEPKDLKYFRSLHSDFRTRRPRYTPPKYRSTPPTRLGRRSDILSKKDDIVKEHAKLVQDINSLRQVLYVPPLADESKDYEDSIFHEILETSTTPRPVRTKGIPILLVGGASQSITTQVPRKKTISLVGTSVSPVKHPYPFESPTRSPVRICMATPWSKKDTAPRRPSLWERIINTIYPR
ncbi:unnamed protein product [Leptosia nina]|uniref:Uncharacterized protein n=1 Tax=Leptosia nina TaxID=320188 RepID=A0AAV1K2Z6_9NEOP